MKQKFSFLSDRFIATARASEHRLYVLARLHRLTPSQFSLFLNRRLGPRRDDDRILALGAMLGLRPEEIFEPAAASVPSSPTQNEATA